MALARNDAGSAGKATGAWERIDSEKLMETPYFVLRSDRLRLPDGAIKDPYYILERPDAAIIFPITNEGEVVMVRQYRPPLEDFELGLPAGLVESGEKPEAAARRELAEETGYGGGEWEFLSAVASSPSLKDNFAHLFLARGVERVADLDPDEYERLETVKIPARELVGKIWAGEIVSSSGVAAIMLALESLREAQER